MAGRTLDWRSELGRWLKPFLNRLGHKARLQMCPLQMCPLYVSGLIGPGDRKSVQPMAARVAVGDYDQLHHFIASWVWDAGPVESELLVQADKLVGGSDASEAIIANWWRQGMMGGAKAHYDGIVAFSQTDFTEDLKKITVPVLVMHSEDDQIVPYVAAGPLSAKLLKNGTLKTYKDFPHGMPTTQAAIINADLLSFIQAKSSRSAAA